MPLVSLRSDCSKSASMNTSLLPPYIRPLVFVSLIGLLAHLSNAAEPSTEKPGTEGDGSHKVGPEYKIDPDLTDKGNPKGK